MALTSRQQKLLELCLADDGTVDELVATAASTDTSDSRFALASTCEDASISVGTETGGNTIKLTIQLKTVSGADIAARATVFSYLSDDANGDSIAGTAPSGGIAVATDGLAMPLIANKALMLTSESDGDIDLNVVEAAGATWYFILVLPNGRRIASSAITFAP